MDEFVLFTNGCSMCYGSELFEDPQTKLCIDNKARLSASWPGQLGKQLGFHRVVNLGYPGSSNDRIIRTTIAWILENWLHEKQSTDNLFVVIGWSAPMRREFYMNENWRQIIPYHDYADPEVSLFNRVYREVAWSEYESAIRFATQIILLQEFFKSHKIAYLFFDAITSFKNTNLDSNNALDVYLKHIIQRNYFNFNNIAGEMATQIRSNNLNNNNSSTHPNEKEHAEWASRLAAYICKERLISFCDNKTTQKSILYEGVGTVEILDRKIGLSKRPPSTAHDSKNIKSFDDKSKILNKAQKKGIWTRLRQAIKRDPFIYD